MAQHTMPPIITSSKIGIGTTFYTSWFFDKFGPKAQLPTPDEVVAIGTRANKETYGGYIQRPPPVRFSNLGILVKWGEYITPAEAVCLHTLRTEFGDQVPVPELYGWHDQPADPRRGLPRLVFIYMEEVIGHTLKERYESLQSEEEAAIAHQLGAMIAHLRTLRPCSSEPCVGDITGGPLPDISLETLVARGSPAGPFPDVKSFHDWFETMALMDLKKLWPPGFQTSAQARLILPHDAPIVFTHADLDMSNIMISLPNQGPTRIVALIDWHQSGWYPAYWEYHKAYVLAPNRHWGEQILPAVMYPYHEPVEAWGLLRSCYGDV